MKVKDIMTGSPTFCTTGTSLEEVARLLTEHDCGAMPVVDDEAFPRPIGIVTDRDIVCRVVAAGEDPSLLTARDCMSSPLITATPVTRLDVCCDLMERNKVRRLVVVDEDGFCCGIVSQADIARRATEKAAEVLKELSQPTRSASSVATSM
jgi:CBS domain-containing protein